MYQLDSAFIDTQEKIERHYQNDMTSLQKLQRHAHIFSLLEQYETPRICLRTYSFDLTLFMIDSWKPVEDLISHLHDYGYNVYHYSDQVPICISLHQTANRELAPEIALFIIPNETLCERVQVGEQSFPIYEYRCGNGG